MATTPGSGLFIRGGNAVYRELKFSGTGDFHAIMRQSQDDIGGHHLNLVIRQDPDDQYKPFMYVEKAPLAYRRNFDSSEQRSSLSEETLLATGLLSTDTATWLGNLEPVMRSEEALAEKLYPISHRTLSQKWSCPMRRLAFWSKVVDDVDFSPLLPSPPRSLYVPLCNIT